MMKDQEINRSKSKKVPTIFKALILFFIFIAVMVLFFHLLFKMLIGDLGLIDSPIEKFSIDQGDSQLSLEDFRLLAQTKDDPFLGGENAPIVIVKFTDFGCPFCKQEVPVIERLVEKYQDNIKIIFRDFPVETLHPNATLAAKYANCSRRQGKYWEMSKELYSIQGNFSQDKFNDIANNLELDMDLLSTCITSNITEVEIASDQQDGLALGVNQTPVFFINGTRVAGAIPYDTFERIIDLAIQQTQ